MAYVFQSVKLWMWVGVCLCMNWKNKQKSAVQILVNAQQLQVKWRPVVKAQIEKAQIATMTGNDKTQGNIKICIQM